MIHCTQFKLEIPSHTHTHTRTHTFKSYVKSINLKALKSALKNPHLIICFILFIEQTIFGTKWLTRRWKSSQSWRCSDNTKCSKLHGEERTKMPLASLPCWDCLLRIHLWLPVCTPPRKTSKNNFLSTFQFFLQIPSPFCPHCLSCFHSVIPYAFLMAHFCRACLPNTCRRGILKVHPL